MAPGFGSRSGLPPSGKFSLSSAACLGWFLLEWSGRGISNFLIKLEIFEAMFLGKPFLCPLLPWVDSQMELLATFAGVVTMASSVISLCSRFDGWQSFCLSYSYMYRPNESKSWPPFLITETIIINFSQFWRIMASQLSIETRRLVNPLQWVTTQDTEMYTEARLSDDHWFSKPCCSYGFPYILHNIL